MTDAPPARSRQNQRLALICCAVLAYVFLSTVLFYRPAPAPGLADSGTSPPGTERAPAPPRPPGTKGPFAPDAARGCTQNASWTAEQNNRWVREIALHLPLSSDASMQTEFELRPATPGESGPLCASLTVRVDYWKVHVSDDTFMYTDSDQQTLGLDGRTANRLVPPFRVDGCTGVLVAVYTGTAMTSDELPVTINSQSRRLTSGLEYDVRHELNFGRTDLIHKAFSKPTSFSRYVTPTC